MAKKTIKVQNLEINISVVNDDDYISLTDIAKGKEGEDHIKNWMRNRNTVEFIGLWEAINNPNFNNIEFDNFRIQAGLNSFNLTPKKWITATNAIGIVSKAGRYGGTYAHKDIAFEFATWISPAFKLWLIKEFDRLKQVESNEHNLDWNVKRILSKVNYAVHTDAVKKYLIPKTDLPKGKERIEYAKEADVLNFVLFGITAQDWRTENPKLALEGKNIRDTASINELMILSTLESLNAIMIKQNIPRADRIMKLIVIKNEQAEVYNKQTDFMKSLKKSDLDSKI